MSRGLRRILSWLAVLALMAAAVAGYRRLPGAGGVADELRWLLARDYVPTSLYNQAAMLIRLAGAEDPGARGRLFETLLLDEDPRLVHGGLTLLSDQLCPDEAPSDDLRRAFAAWLGRASVAEKVLHLRLTLSCSLRAKRPDFYSWEWKQNHLNFLDLPLTDDDYRWMVAGTLQREIAHRAWAATLLFRRGPDDPPNEVRSRLRLLDEGPGVNCLVDAFEEWPALNAERFVQIDSETLREYLRPSTKQVAEMLSDSIDAVRWGAGRILAVAGDARGLPAFREWLRAHPRHTPVAELLMTELYGPDWRKLCESGSATSQPGAGDGGG